MIPESVIDPNAPHLDRFWQYVYERQAIWHRRFIEKLPAPWTTDPTLMQYSFTNAYRELDRGTVFWINRIKPKYSGSHAQLVGTTLAYRHFNRIDTWQRCFEPHWPSKVHNAHPDWVGISIALDEMVKEVGSVFTGAFMVTGSGVRPGEKKHHFILSQIRRNCEHAGAIANLFESCSDPVAIHKRLKSLEGIGPFLAYEIYSDLMYCDWTIVKENDWANPGPGCMKGLDLIFPGGMPGGSYLSAIRYQEQYQHQEFKRLGLDFASVALRDKNGYPRWLSMRNCEHNNCEYSKYARGRARSRFVSHGDNLYEE